VTLQSEYVWIGHEFSRAGVPSPWSEYSDDHGQIFYYNHETCVHPALASPYPAQSVAASPHAHPSARSAGGTFPPEAGAAPTIKHVQPLAERTSQDEQLGFASSADPGTLGCVPERALRGGLG
jgi:hypothetical protein